MSGRKEMLLKMHVSIKSWLRLRRQQSLSFEACSMAISIFHVAWDLVVCVGAVTAGEAYFRGNSRGSDRGLGSSVACGRVGSGMETEA
jgi:hypothetical protein